MTYAEVCVNSPIPERRTFSYSIPQGMNVAVGHAVFVPFGSKLLQGVVMELTDTPSVEQTKDIAGIIESSPILSSARVALANWLSRHYLSPLFDAVSLMLPPEFGRKALAFFSASVSPGFDLTTLSDEQRQAVDLIGRQDKTAQKVIEKEFGPKKGAGIVRQLVGRGLVEKSYELEPIRVKPRLETYLKAAVEVGLAEETIGGLEKRSSRQAALLSFLVEQAEAVSLTEARRETGCTRAVADALESKGLIRIEQLQVRRDPLAARAVNLSFPLTLTPDQQLAFQAVCRNLAGGVKTQPKVILLRGVTASGKTEVYLQSLAEAVRMGKRGIVLVPEIALTPQTIERFASRFPGKVAVLHSGLTAGERFDEWGRIRRGEVDVVIGPRSAVFAPQPDLGIVVLDEEHEWTYKQSDNSPRYHARDVALKLAELTGATVVLGSATPDVESYYRAQRGDYQLLELPERVTPGPSANGKSPLPPVEIVDMRQELKSGNRSMFSRALSAAIAKAVSGREQVMLFLNRRGGATFIQCRDCGFVLSCRRCNTPLSYHPAEDTLLCHRCNYHASIPLVCPQCKSRRIKFLGSGTEQLQQETSNAFPNARLLRWDSDTTRGRNSHEEILEKFRSQQADILIGTQMIAKGLDLPRVTLVGVVNADVALHLPDFRAGERTFQLLTQVAGRAGRGPMGGQVIFQTYSPDNYAVQAAAGHDYVGFYQKEIEYRRLLNNPPFSRLVSLVYSYSNNVACQHEAERMQRALAGEIASRGIADIGMIGPAPAFVQRLRGRFRWQIVLRGADPASLLSEVPVPQGWTVDVDPVGL